MKFSSLFISSALLFSANSMAQGVPSQKVDEPYNTSKLGIVRYNDVLHPVVG